MAERKLRPLESVEVQTHIARLHNYGYDQDTIALKISKITGQDISQQLVSYYLKKIRKKLSEAFAEERDILADQALSQLRQVRKDAYEAYRRTLKPLEKQVLSPDGEVITLVNHRDPSSQFLNIVRETIIDEIKLKGLNEPDRIKMESQVQVLDWTTLLTPVGPASSAAVPEAEFAVLGAAADVVTGEVTVGAPVIETPDTTSTPENARNTPGGASVINPDSDPTLVYNPVPRNTPAAAMVPLTGPPPDLDEVERRLESLRSLVTGR